MQRLPARSLVYAAMLVMTALAFAGSRARAAAPAASSTPNPLDRIVSLRIEPQPLDEALRALAKQANLQILFDAALVAGRTVAEVRAATTARLVLARWLTGTRLMVEERAPGVIVVRAQLKPAKEIT